MRPPSGGCGGFLEDVPVGAAGQGIDSFLGVYFEELLTYGNAVGEMVVSGGQVAALYNASLESVELEQAGPPGGEGLRVGWGPAPALPLPGAAAGVRPEPGGPARPGARLCCGGCPLSARFC